MKGRPPLAKRDVRRAWECPICGKRVKTPGHVVTQPCDCLSRGDPPRIGWMRLCEPDLPHSPLTTHHSPLTTDLPAKPL
jgi:hypothetical protein